MLTKVQFVLGEREERDVSIQNQQQIICSFLVLTLPETKFGTDDQNEGQGS